MFQFKIISAGWDCFPICEQTLYSIQLQVDPDYAVRIVDDASPGIKQAAFIKSWCDLYGRDRWNFTVNPTNYGAVRSQYEGIRALEPEDEDVIVFLDLDGDHFSHHNALKQLRQIYDGGALLTYGGYRPWPDNPNPVPVDEFPDWVVEHGMYRDYTKDVCVFNHLRTVKWKVLKEIPESYFKWPNGEWLYAGTDYAVMMGSLEIAGGNYYAVRDRTLMYYNTQQPHPDNIHGELTHECTQQILNMPRLRAKF